MEQVNQPESDESKLARGLTAHDIELQKIDARATELGGVIPVGLAEAIARSELIDDNKQALRQVPEAIFVRDILPAISGKLGQVDMRWWVDQFGAPQRGFLVVDQKGMVLFEHPPMAPTPSVDNSKNIKPVGDSLNDYRNRLRLPGNHAQTELKTDLRNGLATDGFHGFVYNIALVERICRRYGESILVGAKPEFTAVINEAVEGLDEALGPLGVHGQPRPAGLLENTNKGKHAYDDDAEETGPASFD